MIENNEPKYGDKCTVFNVFVGLYPNNLKILNPASSGCLGICLIKISTEQFAKAVQASGAVMLHQDSVIIPLQLEQSPDYSALFNHLGCDIDTE